MLNITINTNAPCSRLTRREWLRKGGWGALSGGIGLVGGSRVSQGAPLRSESQSHSDVQSKSFGCAKSVVIIFLSGGQSHLETWDPKPFAPREVRGEFDTIQTSTPGVHIGEHLPLLSRMTSELSIVRSLSHEDVDHGTAVYLSLTGRYHRRLSGNPPPMPIDQPTHASLLKWIRPQSKFIEPAIHVNGPAIIAPNNLAPGQFGGFLGRENDPLTIGDVSKEEAALPGLAPLTDLSNQRLRTRKQLVRRLGQSSKVLLGSDFEQAHPRLKQFESLYNQAFAMLGNAKTRRVCDLTEEPESLRRRYGMHRAGQACLLVRRLVEAEVPLITVMWNHHSRGQDHEPSLTDFYGWDTHNDIFSALKHHLLPRFDQSFSALLQDLKGKGLLENTLVLCFGEFGRAPKVAFEKGFKGTSPGRKHWAAVYSMVAAGAGVGKGQVIGKSDRLGAYPVARRFAPWDIAATIYWALGIDPSGLFQDPTGREIAISIGKPMFELFG